MKRTYIVNGRNGHFAVDEHNDQGSGVSGPWFTGVTRRVADRVAAALNKAYQDGREDQAADSRDLVERAYVAGQDAASHTGYPGESYMGTIPGDVSRETNPSPWSWEPTTGKPPTP
jgi:hypothetical protein